MAAGSFGVFRTAGPGARSAPADIPYYRQSDLRSVRENVLESMQKMPLLCFFQSKTELSPNRTVTTVPAATCAPASTDWEMA